jgi:hypothetical protein
MSSATGYPIWPYVDGETLSALTHIAQLFDSTIIEEKPSPARGEQSRSQRRGLVMSVRAEAYDVALLYAHLTNRRFEADEGNALLARRPDVVVAPLDVLTPDFLRELYSDPGWAPGLITAGSPAALLRQALLRAAALRLCGRTSGKRVDVRPLAEHGRIDIGFWEVLGRVADHAQIRHALGSGSELLTICTVGDGIDVALGPLLLCPMTRTLAAVSEGVAPSCVVSGTCHRAHIPMADVPTSSRFVAPEAIAAKVLVLHACWGIQPAGSLYDPIWGYGYRLANHDRLGAMLTTWQLTIGRPSDLEPLARDLGRGTCLGKALARFNRSASARRTGQLMCLLGDPDLRVFTQVRNPVLRRAPRHERSLHDYDAQLVFLAAYLSTIDPKEESNASLAVARDAVAACQRRVWTGLETAADEPAAAVMRQAVVQFLCMHRTIPSKHWIDLAYPVSEKASGSRCFACGQFDREVTFRLRLVGAGARKMKICIRCGLTEDRPAKAQRVSLAVDRDVARLSLSPPRGGWTASALFLPNVGSPVVRRWPTAEDGKPASMTPIFEPSAPRGAGQVLLFMIDGASFWFARAVCNPVLDSPGATAGPAAHRNLPLS